MNVFDIVREVRQVLRENGRMSLRMVRRQYALDDDALEELIEELVDVQQVARREDKILAWIGESSAAAPNPAPAFAAAPARDPRDYTPKHLAEKILQSKSALEGERKQVTVLFADIKGSMELAGQLDPEAWRELLERFFEILTEGVHRFEGTVNQYTGDGIMALFGAPLAHEDHAQRACFAALHLRDRLRRYADELRIDPGVNFSFRIGLNSGEVVVGRIGDDLRMDYTAQGHTVGLAQRMEQLAPADGIALSEYTQKPVDGFFALRSLGPVPVKGVADPVGVFILEDVGRHRTRLDTARARGLSRFVGRDDEIDALESALQRSLEGTGRVAAVVGEPGVGKSRLCAEFVERCRARDLAVYEAHCPAHGKSIPYLPLLELLRNLFGITDLDGPREARQKIAGELALLDDGFADDRDLVLDFLGVADPKAPTLQLEPAVRQRRLFTFLRRLVQLRTEADPIVLLIDDLHWIDPGSDLFVTQIVEAVSATRTLLLVNFRPEYEAEWTHKSWVLQLPMAPLGSEALAALVRDWVGSAPSVAALPALVGTRSGGNPFFAEEIVLSLLETGCLAGSRGSYELVTAPDALEVPATVQALLAARIDRLGEREKQVLYTAAVIGKEFPRPLLEAVLTNEDVDIDAALAGLLAAELVYERSIYPVAEYAFKHPLTHEVALHAQLTPARQQRHAAVAAALARAEAGRLDEFAGLLAHHCEEAGELMHAAEWHVRAARWVRITDLAASRRHWAQARELLVMLPDTPERTRLLLEVYPEFINTLDLLGADASESEAVFVAAVELARDARDRRTEALLEAIYGWLKTRQNDWLGAADHAQRAIALADAEGYQSVQMFARYPLGRSLGWQGRYRESIRVLDEAISIGGSDDATDIAILGWRPYLECLALRATVNLLIGNVADGRAFAARLPALLHRLGPGVDVSYVLADRIWFYWWLGDVEGARRAASEALQMAERYGANGNIAFALLACGTASTLARRWEEGDIYYERVRQLIAETGAGREWTMFLDGLQAPCQAGMGAREQSLILARRGVERARNQALDNARLFQGVLSARVLRTVGGPECFAELQAQIEEMLEVIERTGGQGFLPMLLLERAGLARLRGDAAGMDRDLAAARDLFAQMGVTGWDDYAGSIES